MDDKHVLRKNPLVLWLIIVLLICVIIYFVCVDADAVDSMMTRLLDNLLVMVVSVTCSIIASILYANITSAENKEHDEKVLNSMEAIISRQNDQNREALVEALTKKVSEITELKNDFSPTLCFQSASVPHEEFNTFLDNKILPSKRYVYYGESLRYTCKRLTNLVKNGINRHIEVELILPNPRLAKAFEQRLSFFQAKERNQNFENQRPINEVLSEEKFKLICCLYALSILSKSICIKAYLLDDVPFLGVEMTDNVLVLEFVQIKNEAKRYPLTVVYEDKQPYYDSFCYFLNSEKSRANPIKVEELTMENLLGWGQEAGIEGITEEMVLAYYNKEIAS